MEASSSAGLFLLAPCLEDGHGDGEGDDDRLVPLYFGESILPLLPTLLCSFGDGDLLLWLVELYTFVEIYKE